ncbi:2-amino-4-hydroxy-6-hydroxymethyldihydropteridine diphosphokinase [Halomonas sp. Bachu 37]|uniref:2-amino-4-hydroxy-6- hydroxymethyldihydropteridine diphosphokinase n=1 Tax=Halomonas kashgarensis TaxID=3084920 RepID=UPI0032162F4B
MPDTSPPTSARHECLISVGSNIEPQRHVTQATRILSEECELICASRLIRTTPVGLQEQPDFINAAFLVRTTLDHAAFRCYLKEVEDRLGRVRGPIKSGPRTMDLDIIAWDGNVVDDGYYRHAYVREPVDEVLLASGRSLVTGTGADTIISQAGKCS